MFYCSGEYKHASGLTHNETTTCDKCGKLATWRWAVYKHYKRLSDYKYCCNEHFLED